ncbi:TonB-dependent receptor [Arachidicoccus ginsenosidivorans]|uniref:TonB-dependent receptor n=1 Tax=Arachidicoccus ginsenosidivorans TaxID=496057 RepID=A0A5B8VIZ3_9BACT|nr:TonB-dependent receptor plug domain-containing protein [Arachidicoccus ginsenosidivorans]QEC70556.1 TonB-dependent receptor [Arachidicoccus ginsenosidivorans]
MEKSTQGYLHCRGHHYAHWARRRVFIIMLGCFLLAGALKGQSKLQLRGTVLDMDNKPLEFATVILPEHSVGTHTDNKGNFTLNFFSSDSVFNVEFRYVNKATAYRKLYLTDLQKPVKVHLIQQSLTLKDVQVQAVRERLHSNTSIVIDREAIEQSQAFSLADILQMLPGKKTTAPNLQSPQTLTLRTDADGQNALNNSFGIAIYIDGVRISNDANMQARNESIRGINGASISNQKYGGFDVTYNGFDLRDIPVERIERIEIIQGVADAKYGEMTNGAILITTRAGSTPLEVSLRANEGSTQITASKGVALGGKAGALNLSGGYTYSNADPTDKIKSYKRINTSLQWSVDLAKQLSNTFGFGYDTRLDNVKMDPDDDAEKRTFQKGHTINLSNRLTWQPVNGFLQQIVLGAAYSRGRQETYNQWLLNGPPKAVADKDTTGIYEGYYIPGAYLAVEQILGVPVTFNGSLDLSARNFNTGGFSHRLVAGATVAGSGNKGAGIIIDPERPRWGIFNNQTERPVDYSKLVPFATNFGFYVQDNLSGKIFSRKYNLNLGFRTDIQNGFAAYQPRLSGHYQLTKGWGISLAYGVSTKAPSLAH